MNRRSFLKIFGIGLVGAAAVKPNATSARVCMRNIETGTITAGTGVVIVAQTLRKHGPVVNIVVQMTFESNMPIGTTVLTLPADFRTSVRIQGIGLFKSQNTTSTNIVGTLAMDTNGQMMVDTNSTRVSSGVGNPYFVNFTFIQ